MAFGKVIKGENAPDSSINERPATPKPARPGIVNAEVYDAQKSAHGILEAAKARAQEIVEAAQRQAEAIAEQAKIDRKEVLEAAEKKGREEGLTGVTEVLSKAHLERGRLLASVEKDAVVLACKIAEKIIGRELEKAPKEILRICATAIETVRQATQMVVRVHPDDAQILRAHRQELFELVGRTKDIAIKEDSEIARGGCVIETEAGTIDAQLSTQIEMIRAVLEHEAQQRANQKAQAQQDGD
jgi:type III secretion protein L